MTALFPIKLTPIKTSFVLQESLFIYRLVIVLLLILILKKGNTQVSVDSLSIQLENASSKRLTTGDITFPYALAITRQFSNDSINLILKTMPDSKEKAFAMSHFLRAVSYKKDNPPSSWIEDIDLYRNRNYSSKLLLSLNRSLGIYYQKKGNLPKAKYYFDRCEEYALKTKLPIWQVYNTDDLTQYQNEKIEVLKGQLKSQRALLQKEHKLVLDEQKTIMNFFWVTSLSFLFIAFLLARNTWIKNKRNKILQEKNMQVSSLNKNLESQVKKRTDILKKSQAKLDLIFHNTSDFIGSFNLENDEEPVLESPNEPFMTYLRSNGFLPANQDVKGMNYSFFLRNFLKMPEDEIAQRLHYIYIAQQSRRPLHYETSTKVFSKKKEAIFDVTLTPIINQETKTCNQIIFTMHDITERVLAQRALKKSERQLATIYNGSQELIGLINLEGDQYIIESFNKPTLNFLKNIGAISADEDIIGLDMPTAFKDIYGLSQPAIDYRIKNIDAVFLHGETFKYQSLFTPPPLETGIYFETTISPIYNANGKCTQALYVARDITVNKKANDKIAASEERLSKVFNGSKDQMFIFDVTAEQEFILTDANQAFIDGLHQMGPFSVNNFYGRDCIFFLKKIMGLSDKKAKSRFEQVKQVLKSKIPLNYYDEMILKTGRKILFDVTATPILNTRNECEKILFVTRNMTKAIAAQKALAASEKRLSAIYNSSQNMIGLVHINEDKTYEVESINQRTIDFLLDLDLMQNPDDMIGQSVKNVYKDLFQLPEATINKRMKTFDLVFHEHQTIKYQSPLIIKDKNINIYFETTISPILNSEGKCKHALYSARDITKQKKSEFELRASEAHAKALFEYSPILIWEEDFSAVKAYFDSLSKDELLNIRTFFDKNPDELRRISGLRKVIDVNQKSIDFYDTKTKENQILNLKSYFVESSWDVIKEELIALAGGSLTFESEIQIKSPKGEMLKLIISLAIPPIYKHSWESVIVSFVDITEREATKRQLILNEHRLSSIYNGTEDQMAVVDITPDGQLILENTNRAFNDAWKKLGIPTKIDWFYNKDILPFIKPMMGLESGYIERRAQEVLNIAQEKKPLNFEELYTAANGKKYLLDITVSPILNKEEVCIKLIFVFRDTTLKHRAKERMISKILETEDRERSRFAKELHDGLGQNLTAASINFNYTKKEIAKLPEVFQRKFESGVKFLTEAIQESRNIAHNLMPQSISDFGYILTIESLLENLNESSPVRFEFYDNLKGTRLPVELELSLYRITQEAINNILKHAEATQVNIQLIKHHDSIILTIEDNGKGFEISSQSSSFGLNSMKNRASAHSGVLDIEGAPGKGTSITLEIPVNFVHSLVT